MQKERDPGAELWAGEGAGVNYSITVRLSQELFKQAPVSGGLGLITAAKVTPTTLPRRSNPAPPAATANTQPRQRRDARGKRSKLRNDEA